MTTDDIPKNCTTCAFQYKCNKGKSMWCTLKKFVILNPEVGCSRHMYRKEFENGSYSCMLYITDEEIDAAAEAKAMNSMEEENEGS